MRAGEKCVRVSAHTRVWGGVTSGSWARLLLTTPPAQHLGPPPPALSPQAPALPPTLPCAFGLRSHHSWHTRHGMRLAVTTSWERCPECRASPHLCVAAPQHPRAPQNAWGPSPLRHQCLCLSAPCSPENSARLSGLLSLQLSEGPPWPPGHCCADVPLQSVRAAAQAAGETEKAGCASAGAGRAGGPGRWGRPTLESLV